MSGLSSADRVSSVVQAPRGKHSEKPKVFYEIIERLYPKRSALELFGREVKREGWMVWGKEAAG